MRFDPRLMTVARTCGTDMTVVVSCAALASDHPDAMTIADILGIDSEIAVQVVEEVTSLGLAAPAEKKARAPKAPGEGERRATRLPQGWKLPPDDVSYARQIGFTDPEIRQIAIDFRDYWQGCGKTKVDWSRTWQGWVRREATRRGKRLPDDPSVFADNQPPAPPVEEAWRPLMQAYRQNRTWVHAKGPEPGQPGCRVPPSILQEFGYSS